MGFPSDLPDPDCSIFDSGPNDVERCGLILERDDGSTYVHEVPNRSYNPRRSFVIWVSDTHRVPRGSNRIVGIIHTHPYRGVRAASQFDLDSIPKGLVGIVYHPSSGSKVWYRRNEVLHEHMTRRRSR